MTRSGRRRPVEYVILAIAAITVASGAFQIVAPGTALRALGLRPDSELTLMLVLASALSALVGAALLHTVLARRNDPTVLVCAGLAKLCGPAVLGVGAARGLVDRAGLVVAAYDLVTGLAVLWYAAATGAAATEGGETALRGEGVGP